ncbi:sulfite exporter TauE/SafE family protein [bacterium]|nr:sulfite exporter TauE/SafE family protein [bacterium]
MTVEFAVAGIEVNPLLPIALAFAVGTVCSMAGVTGAFLLLPLQMTVFGFTSPAVSATNHVYNLFAGIGGPYRYAREGRLLLPLAGLLLAGTIPGIIGGMFIRVFLLPDPTTFRAFVAVILFALGVQTLLRAYINRRDGRNQKMNTAGRLSSSKLDGAKFIFQYGSQKFSFSVPLVVSYALLVGLISGAYGMGGGALLSSFLVGICGLPVHGTAGATILTSFVSSLIGTLSYTVFAQFSSLPVAVAPDWLLGVLLGLGGIAGTYTGALLQRRVPGPVLAGVLGILLLVIAFRYGESLFHLLS